MISISPRKRLTISNLKKELDRLYRENNKQEFILEDPVQFPHRYKNRADIEIAAFLAAAIAWGRRDLILKSAERMFALMGRSPFAFVMNGDYEGLVGRHKRSSDLRMRTRGSCIHRTFFEDDLQYYCRGFRACYTQYGSLEAIFASVPDVWEGIGLFRKIIAAANSGYSKHLANPGANSACKRLHLALRWLVRQEGPVDLGLWKKIPPSSLYIPLDLHVGRTARYLGLLEADRKANDRKSALMLTEKLREFCPEDPVKYDLALFSYQIM